MKRRWLNFSIKNRIQLGVSAFLLVIAVLGSASIYYLHRIQENAESIFTRNYVILEKCQDFRQLSDQFRVDWMRFARGMDDNRTAIRKLYGGIYLGDSVLIDQRHLARGQVQPELMDSLADAFDAFKLDFKQGRFAGSFDTLQVSAVILADIDTLIQLNDRLANSLRGDVLSRYERTKQTVNRVITTMVVLSLTLSGLAFLLLWLIPGYIVGPIKELTDRIERIGDKDFSQRIDTQNRTDEFGVLASAFNRMANRLDDFEQLNISEMVKEKKRTETIIDNLNEAIVVSDEAGMVIWINEQAEKLFGLKRSDMLGFPLSEIQPVNFHQDALLSDEGAGGSQLFNFSAQIDDKTRYFHKEEVQVGGLGDHEGQTSAGRVIIFYDITDFRELDMAKTNFMATLSHQFKTPISAMNISLNLLRNPKVGELNEEQQALLETLQGQNERLLNMVNELLDLGQIESGKIRLRKEEISASELVNHSLSVIRSILQSRSLEVDRQIEPGLPEVEVDLEKVTWVLNNLLTNAARYSPEKGKITVRVEREDGYLRFSVSDQGPGIEEDIQSRIFEKYQRSKFDKTKGTGLGLAIAREIIEGHRGKIGVSSTPGQGSTFYFTIPYYSS